MEGDSIIAGQTPSGVFVVDSADERIPVGRYRLDHTYVAASKHFSAPRTLLVVGSVLAVLGLVFVTTWEGPTIRWGTPLAPGGA